jgi:thiosulfate/3-mercaptopyruvate sulfurtransferase
MKLYHLSVLVLALVSLLGCRPVQPSAAVNPVAAPAEDAVYAVPAADEEIAEYAHPEALATTTWLAEHLDNPSVRIVDVRRNDLAGYEAGHIPGAVHADLVQDLMSPQAAVVTTAPSADAFSATMQRLGIDNDSTVVVYDPVGGYMGAARLWWLLRYYGHDDVKLLNGGLVKWQAEGQSLARGSSQPEAGTFVAGAPHNEWRADASQVTSAIGDTQFLIVDALPPGMFTGEVNHSEPIRDGHIPTAQNLPAPGLIDAESGVLLPRAELARQWEALQSQPNQEAIVYCEAGVFSAFDVFVLYQLGHENIRLYETSLREWGVNPDFPMETGAGS